MIKRFLSATLLLIVLGATGLPLHAQLTELASSQVFAPESVSFDFEGLEEGAAAGNLLARWGITFPTGEWGEARVQRIVVLSFVDGVVRNSHPTESSAGRPMALKLKYPASKVGFVLGNFDGATDVVIDAFDPLGNQLGSLQKQDLTETTFVGVATTSMLGIATLVVSYGNSAIEEEVDDLIVEYVSRPEFVTYLSQIGDGPIPGNGAFQTTVIVSNLTNSTAVGEIAMFDSLGNPLAVPVNGQNTSVLPFTIPPTSSISLTTDGTSDPIGVGYAKLTANVPVEGTAVFRIVGPGGAVETEAGVGSSEGRIFAVGAVQKLVAGDFDSGVAIVNTSLEESQGILDLLDQSGNVVASNTDILGLGPNQHIARFLGQIFQEVANEDFDGAVVMRSNAPLAFIILRTGGGKILASLPAGSTQQ